MKRGSKKKIESAVKVYHKSVATGGKDTWRTPQACFQYFNKQTPFDLDAAADESNHLCPVWYGPGGLWPNALDTSWALFKDRMTYVWLNPPYSLTNEFVAKAVNEVLDHNLTVTMLIAARTDTKVFHNLVLPHADDVYFIKGRISFISPDPEQPVNTAPFPSMVVTMTPHPRDIREREMPKVHSLLGFMLNDKRGTGHDVSPTTL